MAVKFLKLVFLTILSLGLNLSLVFAEEVNQAQAKAVMSNIYDSYVKLIPYIYSTNNRLNKFTVKNRNNPEDKKEKEELLKNLNDLSTYFKGAKHAAFFQKPGFKPSLETINNHLEETILSVQSDNYLFAQKRLNVLGALCVSCHSQLPESVSKIAFGDNVKKEKRDRFDSDFSYANYLYVVRRFDEAKEYFSKVLESDLNAPKADNNKEIVSSLRRIISIDTKIKFNYEFAHASIAKWENDKRFTNEDQKMIKRWSADLATWSTFNLEKMESLPKFIEKHLSPLDMKQEIAFTGEKDISLLISSGILLHHLVENPQTDLAPEILYWLSLVDHRMSQTYFFSLGDLYLKDCVKKYPKSPYARKCYQEYADSIEAGYSGSSGTDIPDEEKKELNKLKALIK